MKFIISKLNIFSALQNYLKCRRALHLGNLSIIKKRESIIEGEESIILVDGVTRFQCKKCSKSYKNKRHLHRHEKEECIDVMPRFECTLCLNKFRRKYHLVRHLNTKHTNDEILEKVNR